MIKKQKNFDLSKKSKILLGTLALMMLFAFAVTSIPIGYVRVGGCGNNTVRLSMLSNGQDEMEQAKIRAQKEEELRASLPFEMGCTPATTYVLYVV